VHHRSGKNIKSIKVFYQNPRGLRTKLNDCYLSCLSENFDVIVLVETWLHGGISDAEVLDDRYVVYRNDRNVNNSGKSIGGGVLIAVKKFLTSKRLSDSNSSLEDV
jgi:hypothetical protein